ncbi:MAG: DHH family phosphoesterase [Acidobacteriaceae bacterium]
MLAEVLNQIDRRTRFVLTSHARPDGDAIGSVLACSQILYSMGKQSDIYLFDGVPQVYRPLPFADRIVQTPRIPEDYDAAIILECDSVQRTRLEGLDRHYLINIDHHSSARPFANVNWIDPDACATAEMIFRFAREARVKLSPDMATCLYTAVLTDTGSFGYSGTSERTFALAQELVHAGANPVAIAQSVYFSNPTAKMRLLGAALTNLHRDGALTWMYVRRDDMDRSNALEEHTEGLVNYALAIEGVEVALFFRELGNQRFRVSLRSKGGVDVAKVAEHFGGGGHACASGCALDGPLQSAVDRVIAQLRIRGFQ